MNRQFLIMLLFIGWVVISPVLHGWLGGSVKTFMEFLPASILFFLAAANLRSLGNLRILRFAVLGMLMYLMIHGIYAYSTNPGETTPFVLLQNVEGEDPVPRLRALGILNDPNEFSQFLLAWTPMLLIAGSGKKFLRLSAAVKVPFLLLVGTCIVFTHSRGALIGVAVMTVMLLPQKYRKFGVIGGAVGVVLFSTVAKFGGAAGRSISVEGGRDRLDLWSEGLGMFKGSPLWGVGYKNFREYAGLTAHNSFLLCAAELGIVGFLLWLSVLIFALRQLHVVQKAPVLDIQGAEIQRWARALSISLYVYLATGFFLSQTYHAGLFLLLGMSAAIATMHAERNRQAEITPAGPWWIRWAFVSAFGSLFMIYLMVRSRAF